MNIFTIRHGESVGNVDEAVYKDLQDHNVHLTELGIAQAHNAGKVMSDFARANNLTRFRIWYSPYKRTIQTKDGFLEKFDSALVENVFEDERLREQDFGLFSDTHDKAEQEKLFPEEFAKYRRCIETQGKVYARPPMGESRMDVALRVRSFMETLKRDQHIDNVVIISHGVTVRALEMAFLHLGVEWFEKSKNPDNCRIMRIYGSKQDNWKQEVVHKGGFKPS